MTQPQPPARRGAWSTYYPWALALYSVLGGIFLFFVIISWIPTEPIPGVPESERSVPYFPGLLTIFFVVMALRQLYLRSQTRD